jgi:hypothetical protein
VASSFFSLLVLTLCIESDLCAGGCCVLLGDPHNLHAVYRKKELKGTRSRAFAARPSIWLLKFCTSGHMDSLSTGGECNAGF